MALISCSECGERISDKAEICIHCGAPLNKAVAPQQKKRRNYWIFGLGASFVFALLVVILIVERGDRLEEVCSVDGCREKIYTDSYCVTHYSQEKQKGFSPVSPTEANTTDVVIAEPENSEDIEAVEIKKNQRVTISDVCAFQIASFAMDKTVLPPRPANYYRYFEAEDGHIFADVILDVQYLGTTATGQDRVLDSVQLIYDEKYTYSCQFVTEENDGQSLNEFTSLYSINPLQSMRYHMITQVPSAVKNDGKSLCVVVTAGGVEYTCKIR